MQPIGIAGCGTMGAPMLGALLHAGFDARGLDIDPAKITRPEITLDPTVFANGLRTLITVVRDVPQTEALLFEDQALVTHATELDTLVLSSTLSPRYCDDLKFRIPNRITLIDAPMSGAQVRAETGTLSFMLGGDSDRLDELQPALDAMGAHFHRMGAFGAGMQAKVLNNLLAASSTVMTRLVLDWADAAGLDEAQLLALIHTSSGQNWLASGFDEIEFARLGYGLENSLGILKKDVESALDAAPVGADERLPLLLAELVAEIRPRAPRNS